MLAIDIRPRKFADVVGQKPIIKGLQNFIRNKSIPNVIMFVGNSGIGKNTLGDLMSMIINCDHPKEENGYIEPCGCCASCKDIISRQFQRDCHVYSGNELTVEKLKELEDVLMYNASVDSYTVIQINEAQLCGNLPRLLEILEGNHKGVYWILTSTDKAKFTNSFSKTNKGQQQNAFRSRLAFYNLQPIATDDIKDFLFGYLSKIDPDEKIPDTFVEEGLQVIAENSKNNLRQAVNDFATAINSEAWDADSVRNLLGYEDEKKEHEYVLLLARKDKLALQYISELEDIEGFFVYAWKIISGIALREISGTPEKEEWKEKSAQQIMSTGNLSALFHVFNNTWKMNNGYFNGNTFISELYDYYKPSAPVKQVQPTQLPQNEAVQQLPVKVKKIKKPVGD